MTFRSSLALFLLVFVIFAISAPAQEGKNPADRAVDLRTQLTEVQAQEADLQARLKQLDEDLKPENIERYFAGVGSTKPEDLRALRKSQLERQKASLQRQLELVAQQRARLESAILKADTAAYQQSAQGSSSGSTQGSSSDSAHGPSTTEPLLAAQTTAIPRWLIPFAALIALVSVGLLIVVIRKVRRA